MGDGVLEVRGGSTDDIVGAENEREFGGVVGTLPGTGRDVAEVASVVVAECCGVSCVAISKVGLCK